LVGLQNNWLKTISKFKSYLHKFSFPEYTYFSFYAIIIGAAAGLAAVFFHLSIEFFNKIFFEKTKEGLFFLGAAAVIIFPAIGMLIQSLMISAAPEISKKKGVIEIIKSVALKGGSIPFRTTVFHFFAPVICIGSGGTVGPEGPAAQLGGGVASKISSLLNFSDQRRRIFTAAGAGAAIAAIFNTPLGGVFFALEIILLHDFQTPTFSALILASVTASAISRIFLGNSTIFNFTIPELVEYHHFYLFILLGIICGTISVLFHKYNETSSYIINKYILKVIPRWILMVSVGLFVGICGYFFQDLFGIGYAGINNILAKVHSLQVVIILLLLKIILVPLVLNCGGFGGTFAPSLFMGASIGYIFSNLVTNLTGVQTDPTTYILVGMGAMLGGINSIPITAILMIFEMTLEYSFILPLMLSVIVSSTIAQIVNKGSYHLKLLEKQGYKLSGDKRSNVLKSILVRNIMHQDPIIVSQYTSLTEIVEKLMNSSYNSIFTINDLGELSGIITNNQIKPLITEFESLKMTLVASDIADTRVFKVKSSDDLDYTLNLLTKTDLDELPVVDDGNKITGIISRQDILNTYNKESIKQDLTDGMTRELQTLQKTKISKVADGYAIVERKPGFEFIGKTISDLRIRNKYGLEILMIKKDKQLFEESEKESSIIMPRHDYKIEKDDILILFGPEEKIKQTADW
jgi:CIC family chloride channel protein